MARNAADQRGVTLQTQQRVFQRYRIPRERWSYYTIDHLIPKELGGADRVENLWPQRLNVRPYGPHRKEVLTGKLLALIETGEMTLAQAQQEMREDWISSFVLHIGMVYLTPGKPEPAE